MDKAGHTGFRVPNYYEAKRNLKQGTPTNNEPTCK